MMSSVTVLVAVLPRDLPRIDLLGQATKSTFSSMAPVIVAALAILFALIIWAVFFRKPASTRDRGRVLVEKSSRRGASRSGARSDSDSGSGSGSGRRRRRRGSARRNPTLAETGGLPPIRPSDAPPPGL